MVEVAGHSSLKLEWAHDSAFRFFPVEHDAFCGYRLHAADAAVNKMLAMAGRVEVRDFVDVLHLDEAGSPASPDPSSDRFRTLERHVGSVGGAWPTAC